MRNKVEATRRLLSREVHEFLKDCIDVKRFDTIIKETDIKRLRSKMSNTKMAPIIEDYIQDVARSPITFREFENRLRRLMWDFNKVVLTNMDDIKKRIDAVDIESWTRLTDYPDIKNDLLGYIHNDSDVEILLDAHDLVINRNFELDFITGDWKDVKSNEHHITLMTRIHAVRYLSEFN